MNIHERREYVQKPFWRDQIADLLHKRDVVLPSLAVQENDRRIRLKQDTVVEDMSLPQFLEFYNVQGYDVHELSHDTVELRAKDVGVLPHVPSGYGFGGGAARYMLSRALGNMIEHGPRDLDIVRDPAVCADDTQDVALAAQYNPRDAEFGKKKSVSGVEVLSSLDGYFSTRDFTINEVVVFGTTIQCTTRCLHDTVRHILRLTQYEKTESKNNESKIFAKMIRLYAEGIVRYGEASHIVEDEAIAYALEESYSAPFWFALQLDKACEISLSTAEEYVQQLKDMHQVPDSVTSVETCAKYLLGFLYNFYYRYAPVEQYEEERRLAFGDVYEQLPKQRGHGKSRGDI